MTVSTATTEPLDYVRLLKPSEHAIAFYDTNEQKWQLIAAHLAEALNKGNSAFYGCYFESAGEVRSALQKNGIETDAFEKENRFRILELGAYIRDGRYARIVTEIDDIYRQLSDGGRVLREAGDMTFPLREGFARSTLEFERSAGRVLKWPITAICAYETEAVTAQEFQFFKEVVKAHGHVIFRRFATIV